jgi:hypothetical protein
MERLVTERPVLEPHVRRLVETLVRKGADYTAQGDPFSTFRAGARIGVDPGKSIYLRMSDKWERLTNLMSRPPECADETLSDTVLDLAGYAMLLMAWLAEDEATR